MAKGFTLRLGELLITLGMPSTLASQLTDGDEARLKKPIDALEVSITAEGFLFVTADDLGNPKLELKYEPAHFDRFLSELSTASIPREAIFRLDTAGASTILRLFYSWLNTKQAAVFEEDIRAGKMTFEEARDIRKEVFDVPSFARFFQDSWLTGDMPKGKKGKRRSYSENIEALYALACRIYHETPRMSFEEACYSATEQRPDLVPPSWSKDPDGNLKREATRYWDKSRYSQKNYRERRDS
ncbi:hypothetical protein CDR19_21105 [Ectopseudomonas toyotomiensis]|uniref:Uncharacterized protein n=1 Tax=Ectopseudomonas toyotomiensis TaxID=554344 RepID=A0A1I5XBA8_9GAMM|nr:hypothetical protein [Pseudomonas toyotomiensis]PIA68467.1 hypothetical protein CDR19_21105 [Pseudomonas toyotomiensis]SFQ28927.1 hypothetical protein SAMN05216177_110109 [Pseudomonas toyotomiensis]